MKVTLILCIAVFQIYLFETVLTTSQAFMTTDEIVQYYNYSFEKHEITASDGMITVLHRIPHGFPYNAHKARVPVLIFHALLCSSVMMVQDGIKESIAFVLADAGYDVWLANQRGNSYSNRSTQYSTEDDKFWNFSWQESSLLDIPASIDYILTKTGHQKLFYICHSMGCNIGFAMLSIKTEYNQKLHGVVALGPALFVHHSTSLLTKLSSFFIEFSTRFPEYTNIPFSLDILRVFLKPYCEDRVTKLCMKMIQAITGDTIGQFNLTRFGMYMHQIPDRTSFKTVLHFSQIHKAKQFQMFDHGTAELNIKAYNQSQPPVLDLRKVSIPVALYPANDDILANPADVEVAANALPNVKYYIPINLEGFGHLAFIWGKVAPTVLYPKILDFLKITMNSIY